MRGRLVTDEGRKVCAQQGNSPTPRVAAIEGQSHGEMGCLVSWCNVDSTGTPCVLRFRESNSTVTSAAATNSHQMILTSPLWRGQNDLSSLFSWCREGESNPHDRKDRRILSPLRLPVPPSRLIQNLLVDLQGPTTPRQAAQQVIRPNLNRKLQASISIA